MDDMIRATCTKMSREHRAWAAMSRAIGELRESETWLERAETGALIVLQEKLLASMLDDASARARQLGWQVATYEIAPVARESGSEPITFITGNSHMPPLRAFGVSEEVWDLNDARLWEAYVEGLDERLQELQVEMACPEYDNALYVVDLARFEHVDEEDQDGDDLQSEWRPKS